MAGVQASRRIRRACLRLRAWIQQAWLHLRTWWGDIRRDRDRFGRAVGLALAPVYYVLAGYVPAAYVEKGYANGPAFIALYSPVFRYPEFFGWLTIILLIRPVLYLTSLRGFREARDRLLMLLFLVAVSVGILMVNVDSRNIPPFEVDARVLQADGRLKDHFTMSRDLTPKEKEVYQETMLTLLKERKNWSTARYWYHLSVFIQIFNVLFIFAVTCALTVYGFTPDSGHSYEFKEALVCCSLALLVSYLWLLMRVAFNYQKPAYFPKIDNPTAELAVIALFLLATLFVAVRLGSWLLDTFSTVFSLASAFAGLLGTLSAVRFQEPLVNAFGKNSGTAPYWTILLVVGSVLLIFFIMARKVGPVKGADSSGPSAP